MGNEDGFTESQRNDSIIKILEVHSDFLDKEFNRIKKMIKEDEDTVKKIYAEIEELLTESENHFVQRLDTVSETLKTELEEIKSATEDILIKTKNELLSESELSRLVYSNIIKTIFNEIEFIGRSEEF